MGGNPYETPDNTQSNATARPDDNLHGEYHKEAGSLKGALGTQITEANARSSSDLVSKGKLPDVHVDGAGHGDARAAKQVPENGADFVAKHPHMTPSEAEQAKMRKAEDKLEHSVATRQKAIADEQKALSDDVTKLKQDLAAAGIKDTSDPAKFKEELAKLPADKQDDFRVRIADIKTSADNLRDLQHDAARDGDKAAQLKEKLSLKDDLKVVDALPPAQRAEVYKSLEQILDTGDKSQTTKLTLEQRQQIANDLIHQIAHPEDIKQGMKNTCALASIEDVISRQNPDIYARAIASIATHGELNGEKVPVNLKDDGNNERSLASKLFQTAAANVAVADTGAHYENYKAGEAPKVAGLTPSDDTGERLVSKDGTVANWPGLDTDTQAKLLDKLTGQKYAPEVLSVDSQAGMQKRLEEEAAKYGFPIKVGFSYDNGNHTVTINGIDHSTNPPKIIYDDSAEPRGAGHSMPMDEFYRKALRGESIVKSGGQVYQVLMSDDGDGTPDAYLQVIHRPKA